MQNERTKELLYKASERLPSSGLIAARVLTDIKLQEYLKRYGAGKPIFIIYGEPGTGKTSLTRVLLGKCNEIKISKGLREVKKTLNSMICNEDIAKGKILFLDNFTKSLSWKKLSDQRDVCDYIIDINSETVEAPITVITGERILVGELKKSEALQERSLMMRMNKIDNDTELYEIRDYFSIYQEEYKKIWELYNEWEMKHPVSEEDVLQKLTEFRKKFNRKYENRQIGLVFCYFYAIQRFSDFMESAYGEAISIGMLEKNIKELFEWKNKAGKIHHSYEVDVWTEFLKDEKIFDVYKPSVSGCRFLIEGSCNEYIPYSCSRCSECEPSGKYNPMELMLQSKESAVLIEDVTLIPYFPKHIACDTPILIIGKDVLLNMLNVYLEEYSRKKDASVQTIAPKRFTKVMYAYNLCLFKYEGKRGNNYTFKYKTAENEDVRVLFIKLRVEEYQRLKAIAKPIYSLQYYEKELVKSVNNCLEDFGAKVQSLVGEIGTPSMVLDAVD